MGLSEDILKRVNEVRTALIEAREKDNKLKIDLAQNDEKVEVELDFPDQKVKVRLPIKIK